MLCNKYDYEYMWLIKIKKNNKQIIKSFCQSKHIILVNKLTLTLTGYIKLKKVTETFTDLKYINIIKLKHTERNTIKYY